MDDLRNSSALQTHIQILQDIMKRYSNNSTNCKTWCITISSAFILFVLDNPNSSTLYVGFIPIILFFMLDSFYVSVEHYNRSLYTNLIKDLNENKLEPEQLFNIEPPKGMACRIKALSSAVLAFSVWPFYLLLSVALVICADLLIA